MSGPVPSMRTPLGRVRGRGAAGSGTSHFIAERVSSVALALLSVWFVIAAALHFGAGAGGHEAARAFIAAPFNAVALILFLLASFYHMHLGLQVIVEDYIHKATTKAVLIMGSAFLCVAGAAAGVFAVLKLSL